MNQASMIGIFNEKSNRFNAALNEKDYDRMLQIGIEMIRIALNEMTNHNVPQAIIDVYHRQSLAVLSHFENLSRYVSTTPKRAVESGENEESSDPYYVTKQWFSDEVPNLNFSNIVGVQEVKEAFMVDVVAPLRSEFKEVYKKFRGSELGTQLLLFGPPGTGKTHIVKCLAGALGCKIAVVQTSEILASVVGVAEKNMRDVFEQASHLDRCIIFLDEIDALCSDRSSDDSRNTKSILTTMLTCMDGFIKTTKPGQFRIIVAATNLPWKLDSALKRGGRFEKQIYVPLPDFDARKKFVDMDLSHLPHEDNVTSTWLAEKLDGYSGADIKAIMKQIANKPLRREVSNIYSKSIGRELGEKITIDDCNQVIKDYINSVNPEVIARYEAYNLGISYEDYMKNYRGKKQVNGESLMNEQDKLIVSLQATLLKLLAFNGDK